MPPFLRASLQRRLILLVVLGMMVIVSTLGISSWLAVKESMERTLEERRALAHVYAEYLEYVLREDLRYLEEVGFGPGIDLEDSNLEPEKRALHEAYLRSGFSDGVYVTDSEGVVLWIEPYRRDVVGTSLYGYPHIQAALRQAQPMVSNIFVADRTGRAAVAIVTPVRNSLGQTAGLVGGDMGLPSRSLQGVVQPMRLGETGYVEVVDSQGIVLAGIESQHLLQKSDHAERLATLIREGRAAVGTWPAGSGIEREVVAFAPLPTIPWGMTIRQAEWEALAPTRLLQDRLIILSLSLLVVGVVLAWGTARSVAEPVRTLTSAAHRIAHGDLSQPIPPLGEDEIGELSQSLDAMRLRLRETQEEVRQWTQELEARVNQRTEELERRHQELSQLYQELHREEIARRELLGKVISAQEEERKRIARELHDETTQSLAALVMALDSYLASQASGKLLAMKDQLVRILSGVHQVIFDLRPSLLDDLGLFPALRWYAEDRLRLQGIQVRFETTGPERRLPSEMEVALFRVIQEAVTNIVKHAEAENVVIGMEFNDSVVQIEVEDDGRGFDVQSIGAAPSEVSGLGLLGMRERVELLGGKFTLESELGKGTRIALEVPVPQEWGHGKD